MRKTVYLSVAYRRMPLTGRVDFLMISTPNTERFTTFLPITFGLIDRLRCT